MPLISRVLDRVPVRSLAEYTEVGGGIAVHAARETSPDELLAIVGGSGLRGRGGAGFPTGTKWKTVAASRSTRAVTPVVVNTAEGEPGTFKDRALLRTNPYRVLEGAIVAAVAMQSDQIRIGIKGTFSREIDRLTVAIAELRDAGWLDDVDVRLVLGPSSYLFGEETALLEVIEGRQPFPRVTPPYRRGLHDDDTRSVVGVHLASIGGAEGAPALVDNVETLANIPLLLERGADWFRSVGTERSPGTLVATVSGATRRSGVGEVAMGTTLRDAIDLIGWGPRRGHDVTVVLGGTANALLPGALLDTPLTYEAMRDAGSGLGAAGFIVFDDATAPAAVAAGVARFLSVESCGQCEPCKLDGLEIADVLRRSLQGPPSRLDVEELRRRIETVAVGARCNLAQQQASVAASLLALFPDALDVRPRSGAEPVLVAPIADLVGGRVTLDTAQATKQPDWSHDAIDSGAAPAARLGNTPVHLAARPRPSAWPAWSAGESAEAALDIIGDAHDDIELLLDRAMADGAADLDDRIDDVAIAVRTHVDVTTRVLFPMVRRVGDDDGDRLADAAEAQAGTLLRLVAELDRSNATRLLRDIGVALHDHAAIGDEILDLLRADLDPIERDHLADGLAAARSTSTVSRLHRSASRLPVVVPPSLPARVDAAPPTVDEEAPVAPVAPVASPPLAPARPTPARRRPTTTRHTVLVGVDGSPAAAAALAWAGQLAARSAAAIVVANVFEPDQAEVHPDDYEKLLAEAARRLADDWTAPLRDTDVEHRCVQLAGAPDSLLAATDDEHADLLVVGTRGAGRHAGLHVGSLAHHLAHHIRRPLAIVPVAGAASSIDRIVVGVDGSPGSAAAVRWCADLASAAGAEVIAVCVHDAHTRWGSSNDADDWRAAAEAAISSQWTEPLRAAGVTLRTRIVDDVRPLDALEQAAAEEAAGLFVVGTRGLSEVLGLRLGRVPLQLVHHTQRPVVLVPPDPAS
jgi:NADH:ubiquinone oxidoreductase subunit F (NADH-binding)/nucleotide-binding universal stress UspA family protein